MPNAILVERRDTLATVTLNRPEKMNALDLAAWAELMRVMTDLDGDETLRCVVIRGAGSRAFAAGADIAAFAAERGNPQQARSYGEAVERATMAVRACRHPTIAMIYGACVGGGLVLAACCDLRISACSGRFGAPLAGLGMTMPLREMKLLVDLVGAGNALQILLEGQVFDAAEALRLGLVHRVVDDGGLAAEAEATANRIAAGAPLVARLHKKFVRRLLDPKPLTAAEIEESYAALASEDYKIGVAAFLAKQKPKFTGR